MVTWLCEDFIRPQIMVQSLLGCHVPQIEVEVSVLGA